MDEAIGLILTAILLGAAVSFLVSPTLLAVYVAVLFVTSLILSKGP